MIILAKLKYHYRHHSLLVHPRISSLSSSPLIGPDMVPRRRRPHKCCYPRRSRQHQVLTPFTVSLCRVKLEATNNASTNDLIVER